MKKNLIIILAIIAPFILKAQTDLSTPEVPLDEEGQIRYIELVKEDANANDLFKRCVKWINKEYKNPASVTPTRDMVNKKIVIRHRFNLTKTLESGTTTSSGQVMYDLIVRFKDGRYRAEMTNFVLKKTSKFPCENWLPEGSAPNSLNLGQLDAFAKEKLESLKEGMKPPKEYKEEEW